MGYKSWYAILKLPEQFELKAFVKGEVKPGLGSQASAVATLAAQVEPDEDHPVILIESGVR